MLPAAEKPTEMSYAPMGVYVNMPLNKVIKSRVLFQYSNTQLLWLDDAIIIKFNWPLMHSKAVAFVLKTDKSCFNNKYLSCWLHDA